MTDYLRTIHKSRLFRKVPFEDLEDLLEHLDSQLKFYSRDQIAVTAGRRVRRVGMLIEGQMNLYESDFWEREHLIDQLKYPSSTCDRVLKLRDHSGDLVKRFCVLVSVS